MKLYDMVELNTEPDNLVKRGIHKNCYGYIAQFSQDKCLILFLNNQNSGDFAFAWVKKEYLNYDSDCNPYFLDDLKKFLATHDPAKKTAFNVLKLKEYDSVELIAEKPAYAKHGVHKGMAGCVMESYAVDNEWYVVFNDDNGEYIADICVKEEDLKKI